MPINMEWQLLVKKSRISVFKIDGLVEKPGAENTPSTFASVGSYLLTPDIFPILIEEKIGHGGEIVLSENIDKLAKHKEVYGCFIDGSWYDTGDQFKYMQAIVDFALDNPKYGESFKNYLKKRIE